MWLYLYKNKMIGEKTESIRRRHMTLASSLYTYEHTYTGAHSHKHPCTHIPRTYGSGTIVEEGVERFQEPEVVGEAMRSVNIPVWEGVLEPPTC